MVLVYTTGKPLVKKIFLKKCFKKRFFLDTLPDLRYDGNNIFTMIHRFRSLLFFLFTGIFFITAFSVLFYAFGYRFSFDRGIFIYTGSITIKPNPDTVSIKVDNELIPEKRLGLLNNSIHIGGLAPGEHFIEISAPGYRPWTKKTVVQSGFSTEFWNVLLSREDYAPIAIPDTERAIKIFPALKEQLLAVAKKNGSEFSIDTLDTGTGESERVFSASDAVFSPEDPENIEWTPDSDKLIIPLKKDGVRAYSIVDIETKEARSLEALAKRSSPLRAPRWDPTTRNFLFFMAGTTLYRIDTETPDALAIAIRENVASYDVSGRNLYYMESDNGTVYRIPTDEPGAEPTQITSSPLPADPDATHDYSLVVYDESRLAILDRSAGELFVFNRDVREKPFKALGGSVRGMQFSDDGKKLLFFSDNEISVYFIRVWEAQPAREADTVMQIARFASPLRSVQWTEDYEHVLFSLNGSVKMIELDSRDQRNLTDIASFPAPLAQILSRFEENKVYFVRSDNPENNAVESISFPESSGLFGL